MVHSRFTARAVLLDWDGTLLDSYQADARAYLTMFRTLEIPWGLDDLALHYSPNWYQVYRAARLPRSKWEMADRLWRRAYSQEKPKLLPGARRVLRNLNRRFELGVGDQRKPDARAQATSRIRIYKNILHLHLLRRCPAAQAASRAVATGAAPPSIGTRRLRLRGRFGRGHGNGPPRGSPVHRDSGPFSHSRPGAGRQSLCLARIHRRTAAVD